MRQAGIAYATDQIIDLLANGVKNIHIYSMNRPDVADAIMRKSFRDYQMLGADDMEKRVKEAVRYLGFGRNAADDRTLTLIRSCFTELEHMAGPRYICRIF